MVFVILGTQDKEFPRLLKAIEKEIDKFINDYKKDVDTVEEITEYEAWQDFPEIHQLFELV